jgi:hypothetical protein
MVGEPKLTALRFCESQESGAHAPIAVLADGNAGRERCRCSSERNRRLPRWSGNSRAGAVRLVRGVVDNHLIAPVELGVVTGGFGAPDEARKFLAAATSMMPKLTAYFG